MTGILNKKNELSHQKIMSQMALLPPDIQEHSKVTFETCKDVGKNYKEACDRLFYSTKCMYEVDPAKFLFP
jgi:hypothetical protein